MHVETKCGLDVSADEPLAKILEKGKSDVGDKEAAFDIIVRILERRRDASMTYALKYGTSDEQWTK